MRVVLWGAGLQARAALVDLARQEDLTEITVADRDEAAARELAGRVGDSRVQVRAVDAGDVEAAGKLMHGAQAALSAVPYRFNAGLARAAVAAGCSFCDLGGNNDVVAQELALDEAAREAGVTVVPDCGLAPGLVAVLAAHAMEAFDRVRTLTIRVGGLPQERGGFLDYSLLFNVQGLINEYVEDAVVLEKGEPRIVPSLEDFETLTFPEPFGELEAFTTSGGTSTLPETYRGKIDTLNYKTIRYPGHGRVFQAMKTLGLLSWDEVPVDGKPVSPRALTSRLIDGAFEHNAPDVTLVRVTAQGKRDGKDATRTYTMIEYPDAEHGLTAMMRTTAFPATIVCLMLARGETKGPGALPQERCIDPARFLKELAARNLAVTIEES